ncbi:MAG: hypothetical protein GY805_08270 [Chloroflexi bacterium]|nr:hypothetical protein [Chloroflexota bacterium]
MQRMMKCFIWLMALLLLVGCDLLGGEGENGRSNTEPNSESESPSSNDKLTYEGDPPSEGKGNVFGEIRWNGSGAAGLDLLLCADFSSFSGCGDEEFSSTTDEKGQYLFENIDPGIYALSVKVFDTEDWLYISSGILSSADFEVESGKTLTIETQNIFKLNLNPRTPKNGEKVSPGEVPLDWDDYADADYYKISLYPDEGDAILVDKRANESSIEVDLLPLNCGYRWSVEAFNSDRIKIAETAEQFDFRVENQNGSCLLAIEEPADGAEIRGDDIILNWEDSPLANTYKILMWNDDDAEAENELNFEEVNESSYRFNKTLTPARYVWSVTAYDENGNKVGGTEIFDFTVRP